MSLFIILLIYGRRAEKVTKFLAIFAPPAGFDLLQRRAGPGVISESKIAYFPALWQSHPSI
jgi:hypothetical protein